MRIRIAYKMNNKDVLEEGQINNFPRDLWGDLKIVKMVLWCMGSFFSFFFFQLRSVSLVVCSHSAICCLILIFLGGMSYSNWDFVCMTWILGSAKWLSNSILSLAVSMYIMIKYLFTEIEEIEFCIWGRWKGDMVLSCWEFELLLSLLLLVFSLDQLHLLALLLEIT